MYELFILLHFSLCRRRQVFNSKQGLRRPQENFVKTEIWVQPQDLLGLVGMDWISTKLKSNMYHTKIYWPVFQYYVRDGQIWFL